MKNPSPPRPGPMLRPQAPQARRPAIARPTIPRPELKAFRPAPDPLDESKYPGDPEGDAFEELDQLATGFRDRLKEESARKKGATDSGNYFVLAFDSREQVDAFLQASGMAHTGGGDLFVDGRMMADKLGFKLPEAERRFNISAKVDPKLTALAMGRPKR